MITTLCLVTGATGAVGPAVVWALHRAGYRVRTLSLDVPQAAMFPDSVEVRSGDVTDPSAVQAAMRGVEVVFHLAALLHIVNPPVTLRERYERVNVGGTSTVVEAAVHSGVQRVVFFSTIAVYGYSTGQVMNEDTMPQPDTFYAQTKLSAEHIILDARRPEGRPLGTVLRLGAVYGARIKGNYRQLVQSLARGWFIPIGNGSNRRTLVYDRDVAAAAVLAASHPNAAGQVYNVSDGQFHTMNEIVVTVCESLGRTPPRLSLPVGPVRLASGILEDGARLVGRQSPIRRATVDKYIEDVAVSSQRIQTQLGFVPRFDLAAGWRETVQEMQQMGEL